MKLMMNGGKVVEGNEEKVKGFIVGMLKKSVVKVGESEWDEGEEVSVDKLMEMMGKDVVYVFDKELCEMGDDYVEMELKK